MVTRTCLSVTSCLLQNCYIFRYDWFFINCSVRQVCTNKSYCICKENSCVGLRFLYIINLRNTRYILYQEYIKSNGRKGLFFVQTKVIVFVKKVVTSDCVFYMLLIYETQDISCIKIILKVMEESGCFLYKQKLLYL